jgi:hypothetical protein
MLSLADDGQPTLMTCPRYFSPYSLNIDTNGGVLNIGRFLAETSESANFCELFVVSFVNSVLNYKNWR